MSAVRLNHGTLANALSSLDVVHLGSDMVATHYHADHRVSSIAPAIVGSDIVADHYQSEYPLALLRCLVRQRKIAAVDLLAFASSLGAGSQGA